MNCEDELANHPSLKIRNTQSMETQQRIINAFSKCQPICDAGITIFGAGSLARKEIGHKSDLDLFVLCEKNAKSRLQEYTLFGQLIDINKELGFPKFSNDGEYLILYNIDDLISKTGSRRDDIENTFTARMLLLLESFPIINNSLYKKTLERTIDNYFRDDIGTKTFKPLFLLNDLLRYWRTLCLNYEERRKEPDRPWRKKNINLRFSRMATVFGTILPIVAEPIVEPNSLKKLLARTPLERLAYGVSLLNDQELVNQWPEILDNYETFLTWKEDDDVEKHLRDGNMKIMVKSNAEKFSSYLYTCLTCEKIPYEYRRYLVL